MKMIQVKTTRIKRAKATSVTVPSYLYIHTYVCMHIYIYTHTHGYIRLGQVTNIISIVK